MSKDKRISFRCDEHTYNLVVRLMEITNRPLTDIMRGCVMEGYKEGLRREVKRWDDSIFQNHLLDYNAPQQLTNQRDELSDEPITDGGHSESFTIAMDRVATRE